MPTTCVVIAGCESGGTTPVTNGASMGLFGRNVWNVPVILSANCSLLLPTI